MPKTLLATVVSEPQHQSGEKHRSSGNFSTDSIPKNTIEFQWIVKDNPNSSSIHFNVKHDISGGIDTTPFKDLFDGKRTQNNLKKERNLYISDPTMADNQNFTVEIYAIT